MQCVLVEGILMSVRRFAGAWPWGFTIVTRIGNFAAPAMFVIASVMLAGCAATQHSAERTENLKTSYDAQCQECQDVARDEGNLRRVMGWSPKTLAKAQSLTHLSPDALCALPVTARDQLRSKIKASKKAGANGMIEYLESLHRDGSGKVSVGGLYKSVQQHND